jgi:hypothetical protein
MKAIGNGNTFFHHSFCVVAKIANAMAKNNLDAIFVRALRASGASDNVLTLWIRDDLSSLGSRFNSCNLDLSFVEQLTDIEQFWFLDHLAIFK